MKSRGKNNNQTALQVNPIKFKNIIIHIKKSTKYENYKDSRVELAK